MFTYKQCYPVTLVPCEMTQGFSGSFMPAALRHRGAAYKCRSSQERLNLHVCLPSTVNKTPGWWGWTQSHVEPWLAFLLYPSSLSDMVIEHLTKITSEERFAFWLMVAEKPHSAIVGNSVYCEFEVGPALRKQREGTGSQIRISDLKAHPLWHAS